VSENLGCNGGDASITYNYMMKNQMSLREDYPYQFKQGKCRENVKQTDVKLIGYAKILSEDEDTLKAAIAQIGPIEVSISFVHEKFMRYASGVYFDPECDSVKTNHAVSVVGYGKDNRTGLDYFLVKNSWGDLWGENGFIKIARNKENHCGIAKHAIFPLLKESNFVVDYEDPEIPSDSNKTSFFTFKTIMVITMVSMGAICIFLMCAYIILCTKNSDDDDLSDSGLNKELVDFSGASLNREYSV
jgi:hypothetical protein